MDDLEPPSASDCPFEEGTALHRDGAGVMSRMIQRKDIY